MPSSFWPAQPVPRLLRYFLRETKGVKPGMETRDRIAKTEALFRDVNERIAEASGRLEIDEAEFMCECADATCAERIEVPLEEYEAVRDDATAFLHKPDHVDPEIEEVVHRRRGYAIVQKVDKVVARIVRKLDRRTQPA
jgi:hypothetical protein